MNSGPKENLPDPVQGKQFQGEKTHSLRRLMGKWCKYDGKKDEFFLEKG